MPNGRLFISMRVKFVLAAMITGVSVVVAAVIVLFLIFSVWSPARNGLVLLVGVLSAVAVFLLVMLIYYHIQIRALVLLSDEVSAVSAGRTDAEITATRNDEIGQLAEDVRLMRQTILERAAEKERAWQANSDLLTSMTHDIRTPLTGLLGYLDLLEKDSDGFTEGQRAHLRICTQKAEQIKSLSDKLFLYFWAYNQAEAESTADTESFACGFLMEQLVGEYIPAMEAAALTMESDLSAIGPDDRVRVRIEYLRRVTDNLFDNAVKYADPRYPLRMTAERDGGFIRICFTNTVGKAREHTTSTRIGVKSCVNLMKQMGGRFETYEGGGTFTAAIVLAVEDSYLIGE